MLVQLLVVASVLAYIGVIGLVYFWAELYDRLQKRALNGEVS